MSANHELTPVVTQTGEYIPVSHPPQGPPPKRRGCLSRLFSSFIWMFVIIVLVFFALTFGRQWYDSILAHLDYRKAVHSDESVIRSGIHSQVRPSITLVYQNINGKKVRVIADAKDYSNFVNQQAASLEEAKKKLMAQTDKQLNEDLTAVFDGMHERVERFADWYFAYTTTYKILWEATMSASGHMFSVEAVSLSEAVSMDVEKYLHQHYQNIVLRPEVTDPQLQVAYRDVLKSAHSRYVDLLAQMRSDFQAFVSKYTTHLEIPATEDTELVLDWKSQFNKFHVAEYEKGPKGAALGAALAAGGAATGKAVAGVAGKGVASHAVAGAASKGVFAKLSAPFVTKAVLAGGGGAIGAVGGPVGVAVGAAGGLGIDYAINEGVELTQRDAFMTDVGEALKVTQNEWEKQMQQSLHEAINIWIDDTIQLLPRYKM
jgi:hypothetical protein